MKVFTILVAISFLLIGCSRYEAENKQLKDELKMVREENNFLKAQIVGLQKEIEQMSAQVTKEREKMELQLQEEREQMEKKLQEERKYLQKRIEDLGKKNSAKKKEVRR
jgi:altronate dehydratase